MPRLNHEQERALTDTMLQILRYKALRTSQIQYELERLGWPEVTHTQIKRLLTKTGRVTSRTYGWGPFRFTTWELSGATPSIRSKDAGAGL